MALNSNGFEFAKQLIEDNKVSIGDWSFSDQDLADILKYTDGDISKIYLGVDQESGQWKYPFAKLVDGAPVLFKQALEQVDEQGLQDQVASLLGAVDEKLADGSIETDEDDIDTKPSDLRPTSDVVQSVSDGGTDGGGTDGGGITSESGGPKPILGDGDENVIGGFKSLTASRAFFAEPIEDNDINWEERTIELVFSSEYPVMRSFGWEILDHSDPNRIDLSRMSGKAPLLVNHDENDQVGVVERAWIDSKSRQGRAVVRFGRSLRASEILQDIKDRIRRTVSFSYLASPTVAAKREADIDGTPAYRFGSWQAFEISLASVPADPNVGIPIARNLNLHPKQEIRIMSDTNKNPDIDINKVSADARSQEKDRQASIRQLGKLSGLIEEAEKAIVNDMEVNAFRKLVDEHTARTFETVKNAKNVADLGLNAKQIKDYSIFRAIQSLNPNSRVDAGYERELSDEIARRSGMAPRGFFVPTNVMFRTTVTSASEGDNAIHTVGTGSYVDALRSQSVLMGLSTVLDGLTSDVKIPVVAAAPAVEYDAEDTAAAEDSTFDLTNITLSPYQASVHKPVSRIAMAQGNPSIERILMDQISREIVLSMEAKALNGSGTNEPGGVLVGTQYATVHSGTCAGSVPTYAELVDMLGDVLAHTTQFGNLAYIAPGGIYGDLLGVTRGGTGSDIMAIADSRTIAGYPVYATNVGDSTKIIVGDWQYLYFGLFGGLDLFADPYSEATANNIVIHASQLYDAKVAHPTGFSWRKMS